MVPSMGVELGQADGCHSKTANDTTLLACPSLHPPLPPPNCLLGATRARSVWSGIVERGVVWDSDEDGVA